MTDSRFTLALKYYDSGLLKEAWEAVREIIAEPEPPLDALRLAAALRLEERVYIDAVAFSNQTLARDPENVPALLTKAQALFLVGVPSDGETVMKAALALPGQHPAGWNNLGNVLDALGMPEHARQAFARALEEAPGFSIAHNNLGATLAAQGYYAAAAESYNKALTTEPGNLAAMNNLGVALLEQGLTQEAGAVFDKLLAADPGNREAASNGLYARLYAEDDPAGARAAHGAWGKRQPAPPVQQEARRPGPLRVGYISPDFRRHSVSYFAVPLLEGHDPKAVETFCYSDAARTDAVTARLQAVVHHWRDIAGHSDGEILQLIRKDGLDILVDLAGHTTGNRLGVFARRAAPVQVTAIGYPATTGLPAMDFRLCDAITDPSPTADAWASEILVRLPHLHCYDPLIEMPLPGPLPALAAGHITFGSFNKLAKLSPATVGLWAGVLKAVPGARLIVKAKALADLDTRVRLAQAFGAHGIPPERFDLRGWMPGNKGHLDLYNRIDIALDTFPYNGTTTTCEALWMGVPVLSLCGRSHAARVGASLLGQAGLTDWIVRQPDQFVPRAVRLAGDLQALAALRQELRGQVQTSSLCDKQGYARAVEAAYRVMTQRADSSQQ